MADLAAALGYAPDARVLIPHIDARRNAGFQIIRPGLFQILFHHPTLRGVLAAAEAAQR